MIWPASVAAPVSSPCAVQNSTRNVPPGRAIHHCCTNLPPASNEYVNAGRPSTLDASESAIGSVPRGGFRIRAATAIWTASSDRASGATRKPRRPPRSVTVTTSPRTDSVQFAGRESEKPSAGYDRCTRSNGACAPVSNSSSARRPPATSTPATSAMTISCATTLVRARRVTGGATGGATATAAAGGIA